MLVPSSLRGLEKCEGTWGASPAGCGRTSSSRTSVCVCVYVCVCSFRAPSCLPVALRPASRGVNKAVGREAHTIVSSTSGAGFRRGGSVSAKIWSPRPSEGLPGSLWADPSGGPRPGGGWVERSEPKSRCQSGPQGRIKAGVWGPRAQLGTWPTWGQVRLQGHFWGPEPGWTPGRAPTAVILGWARTGLAGGGETGGGGVQRCLPCARDVPARGWLSGRSTFLTVTLSSKRSSGLESCDGMYPAVLTSWGCVLILKVSPSLFCLQLAPSHCWKKKALLEPFLPKSLSGRAGRPGDGCLLQVLRCVLFS